MTTRALFSVSDEVMAQFRPVVPSRERKAMARQQQIEQLAAMVETGPEFADIRAVAVDVGALVGDAIQ
jgi:hypothetical protein